MLSLIFLSAVLQISWLPIWARSMTHFRTKTLVLITFLTFGAAFEQASAQRLDFDIERVKVPGGYFSNRIHAIVQDDEGFLWLGTDAGLIKYDGHTFTEFGTESNSQFGGVWAIEVDS